MIESFLAFFIEGKKNKGQQAPASSAHEVRITKQWDDFKNKLPENDPLRGHIDNIESLFQRKPWQSPKPRSGQPINNDQYAWSSRYNAHTIEENDTPTAKRILSSLKPGEKWIQGHFPGLPGLPSGRYAWGAIIGSNKDGSTYVEAKHIIPHDKAAT